MQTLLECLPCFLNQAIRTLRMSGMDEPSIERTIQGVQGTLLALGRDESPFQVAERIQQLIREATCCEDLYSGIKVRSNRWVEPLIPRLEEGRAFASDPFEYMLRCSLSGNLIDFGVYGSVNSEFLMKQVISSPFVDGHCLEELREQMAKARSLAILTDNAGEIVFDRFWLEWVQETYNLDSILIAVRDRPFLNDATLEDSRDVGLDRVLNASLVAFWPEERMPGKRHYDTWERLKAQDLLIAKGQANFEALSSEPNVFFHFVVKCAQVAKVLVEKTNRPVEIGSFVSWRESLR